MTDHYSLFTQSKQDILLVKLTEIYLEYYKIKKEFVDNKDIFLKDYTPIITEYSQTESEINNISTNNTTYLHSSIFNKLVLLTHPDKNTKSNPILYQQVKEAHENNKIAKMYFLAKYMNIPIRELSEDEIKILEEAIQKKKNKIEHYSKTYPVLYGRAISDSVRERLLRSFKNNL